jgi:hypothetical protein
MEEDDANEDVNRQIFFSINGLPATCLRNNLLY